MFCPFCFSSGNSSPWERCGVAGRTVPGKVRRRRPTGDPGAEGRGRRPLGGAGTAGQEPGAQDWGGWSGPRALGRGGSTVLGAPRWVGG